ncbi:hypothetical protein FB45DRAFT_75529 [Roridomyces roridus]|uniref:Uncharacterized protein n=1 Tax=Roridomyces roridus TaxID=1738132 RepID=A0AAD7BNW5_9AGAR|nr:hypothetical protein FB45DRAFT_75529 [Roridomyces roridus]
MPCKGRKGKACSERCVAFRGGKHDSDKCRDCGHRSRHHTSTDSIEDIVARYDTQELRKRTTDVAARAESAAGFRSRGGAQPSVESAKTKEKKKNKETGAHMVEVDHVYVITTGLDSDGELRRNRPPTPAEIERRRKFGLTIFRTQERPLRFSTEWSEQNVAEWLRKHLPDLFEFLDLMYPHEDKNWVFVAKAHSDVYAIDRGIDGAMLDKYKGAASRGKKHFVVRIATKQRIPSAWYTPNGFANVIERLRQGEELMAESESEDEAPRKKSKRVAMKTAKGKAKAKVESDSEEEVSAETQSSEDDVVVVKQKQIPDLPPLPNEESDSDIEEIFPSTSLLPLGAGSSRRKRSRSKDDGD